MASWQIAEGNFGPVVFRLAMGDFDGRPPLDYLKRLSELMEPLLANPSEKAASHKDEKQLIRVASAVYAPIHVRVSMMEGTQVPEAHDETADDLWTPMYMAMLCGSVEYVTVLLRFHVCFALRLLRLLSPHVVTVGENQRSVLIVATQGPFLQEARANASLSLSVQDVSTAMVPLAEVVAALPKAVTSAGVPTGAASTETPANPDRPPTVPLSPKERPEIATVREVVRNFFTLLHEGSFRPSSPLASDARGTTVVAHGSEGSGSLEPERFRHQIFLDAQVLFDKVCAGGDLRRLSRLQELLPIGPVFEVASGSRSLSSAADHKLSCDRVVFPVAPQEGLRFAFYRQLFPEIPTSNATLRQSLLLQREMLSTTSNNRSDDAIVVDGASSSASSGWATAMSPSCALTTLHFRLLNRLLSKSQDVAAMKDLLAQSNREVRDVCSFPLEVPVLYGLCAEYAVRPEAVTQQLIFEKASCLFEQSWLIDYLVSPLKTETQRFAELWFNDTVLHPQKKFKTRVEMLTNAVFWFENAPVSTAAAAESPSGNQAAAQLRRRSSMGALPSTVTDPPASSTEGKHHGWLNLWERLFQRLAVAAAERGATGLIPEGGGKDDALPRDIVAAVTDAVARLRAARGLTQTETGGSSAAESDVPLEVKFERAQKAFSLIADKQPNEVKLRFYGLYKQGVVGDVNISRPWAMDVTGRAKYDAWASCKGLSRRDAMQAYVDQWLLLETASSQNATRKK